MFLYGLLKLRSAGPIRLELVLIPAGVLLLLLIILRGKGLTAATCLGAKGAATGRRRRCCLFGELGGGGVGVLIGVILNSVVALAVC